MVIAEVPGEDAAEMLFADTMVWSRHSRRTDPMRRSTNAFCHGVCAAREYFIDVQTFQSTAEYLSVDCVAIAQQGRRRSVVGEGVNDLLSRPRRGRMFSDVEVHEAAVVVGEDEEGEADDGAIRCASRLSGGRLRDRREVLGRDVKGGHVATTLGPVSELSHGVMSCGSGRYGALD
jgi:hypothetical protein